MRRWILTLLLVASLGLVSTGCPQQEPVIPPTDDPVPEEPASPPDHDHPHDHEHPEEPVPPPEDPGSP